MATELNAGERHARSVVTNIAKVKKWNPVLRTSLRSKEDPDAHIAKMLEYLDFVREILRQDMVMLEYLD